MQALGILSPVEEANATLIAAAPDLLGAIPPLIALVHRLLPAHVQADSTLDNLAEVLGARTAIAKATGGRLHNYSDFNPMKGY
jgi:hypothetical protein